MVAFIVIKKKKIRLLLEQKVSGKYITDLSTVQKFYIFSNNVILKFKKQNCKYI